MTPYFGQGDGHDVILDFDLEDARNEFYDKPGPGSDRGFTRAIGMSTSGKTGDTLILKSGCDPEG